MLKLRKKPRAVSHKVKSYFLANSRPEASGVWLYLTLPGGKIERTGHVNLSGKLQYSFLVQVPQIAALPILLLLNLDVSEVMSDYQKVVQLHKQHQATVKQRLPLRKTAKQPQRQKRHRYEENSSEANAREYTARVIAAAIVEVVIELQVSRIVLPDLSGIRERVEACIRAAAKAAHPHHVAAQNQYAKDVRGSYHRWNYGQLATTIGQRAARAGLPVRSLPQFVSQSPAISATSMARAIFAETQSLA